MLDPIAKVVIGRLTELLPERSEAEIHWAYQLVIGIMVHVMSDSGRIRRLSDGAADPADPEETLRHLVPLLLHGMRAKEPSRSATAKSKPRPTNVATSSMSGGFRTPRQLNGQL